MHDSSMEFMKGFVEKYLSPKKRLEILDVGSYDVNGNYRALFDHPNWRYLGMDLEPGPNVDLIAKKKNHWGLRKQFDVIVSGQCLEHVQDTKEWINQVNKHLKSGGIVCIIAPWMWEEHRFPMDCWRILPDGMRFLLEDVCGFEILEVFKEEHDCVGIARKSKGSIIRKFF